MRWTGVQWHTSQCREGCIAGQGAIYSDRWMVLGLHMYPFVLYVTLKWLYWLNPLSLVFRLMVHICHIWFRGVPVWGSQKNFRGDVFKAKWACYVNISFELEKKCSRRWGVNVVGVCWDPQLALASKDASLPSDSNILHINVVSVFFYGFSPYVDVSFYMPLYSPFYFSKAISGT